MSLREYANTWLKDKGMSNSEAKKDAGKYKSIAAAKKAGSLYYTDKNGKVMLAVYAEDLKGPKSEGLKSSPRPKLRPESNTSSEIETDVLPPADGGKPAKLTVKEIKDVANTALNRAEKTRAAYEEKKAESNERRGPSSSKAFNDWFDTNKSEYKKDSGGYDMKAALSDFNASRKSGMSKGGMAKRGGYMKGGSVDRRNGMFYNSQSPRGYK